MKFLSRLLLAALIIAAPWARAEDGYDLWLRYRPLSGEWLKSYREAARELVPGAPYATLNIVQAELARALGGLLGVEVPKSVQPTRDGSIIFGTPASSALIAGLKLDGAAGGLGRAGSEGYLIRSLGYDGHRVTVIVGNTDIGVLHGTFHFLRLLQTHQPLEHLNLVSAPRIQHRVLDHWDNLDRLCRRVHLGLAQTAGLPAPSLH
jgi:alpha-glucuronidase